MREHDGLDARLAARLAQLHIERGWSLDELSGRAGISAHELRTGDCLRFRLWGASRFRCPGAHPVRYAVLIVLP